jgi:hypothetical protein
VGVEIRMRQDDGIKAYLFDQRSRGSQQVFPDGRA